MTQEDKDLLLKDLCGRLPYRMKFKTTHGYDTLETIDCFDLLDIIINTGNEDSYALDEIKPYLFPLSSMTDEQYEEFIIISGWDGDIEDIRRGKFSCIGYVELDYIYDAIDWLNKNHFDYRNLIEKNLAIDCANLNIY